MRQFRPLIAVVAVALAAWKPEALLAPSASITSAATQFFTTGDGSTAMSAATIVANADAVITTGGAIRIMIPATLPCTWDTTDTTAACSGTAVTNLKISATPTVTYEANGGGAGNKVVVIPVIADFVATETVVVSGLSFANFSGAAKTELLELDINKDWLFESKDLNAKGIGAPTISSAASQVFHVNGPTAQNSTITIKEDANNPRITAVKDVRIRIPAACNMVFVTTDTAVTITGTGALKVNNTAVTFPSGNKLALIAVNTDLAVNETLIVDGLTFAGPTAVSGPTMLELDNSTSSWTADQDDKTITINAQPLMVSGGNQSFHINDAPTAIQGITVTDSATPVITAAGDIRIRIPATVNMTWDTADASAVCIGTAVNNGRIVGAPTVTFEAIGGGAGNKVAVIPVGTNFAASEAVTISGLSFANFTAVSGATSLELLVDGATGSVGDLDSATVTILTAATIVSGANQIFRTNDPSMPISQIVVTDAAVTASITAAGDIRIRIPAGLNMTWDTSDAVAACTGNAVTNGRITTSPTVTFEGSNKVVVIPVGSPFSPSETVTITGLSFTAFSGAATGSLELVISGSPTGPTASVDTRTIQIAAPPTMASAGPQVFTVGDPSLIMTTVTITESAVPSITIASGIRLTIPPTFPMTWDKSFTTAVLGGGPASGRVSQTVTFADLDHTAVFAVTQNFVVGDVLTIAGLSFANFSAGASADFLTLNADADAAADATDTAAKSIGAPTILSGADQLFREQDPPELIAPITIADGPIPRIKAANDIRIRIPAGFPMTFLTTDTTCTISGSASGKVLTSVAYENGGMTAVLDVTNDFAASQDIIVSGLAFANFAKATSTPDHLELEVNNLGTAADEDTMAIAIYAIGGSAQDGSVCAAGGSAVLGVALLLGLAAIALRRA